MRRLVYLFAMIGVVITAALGADSWAQSLVVDWKLPEELVLRCEGWIGSWSLTSWYKEREEIAAHIKNGSITFSGNKFLLGQHIAICPLGTLGIPADSLYFSSVGCGIRVKLLEHRQYGTLNTILLKLDLSNTDWRTDRALGITGEFNCTKVN